MKFTIKLGVVSSVSIALTFFFQWYIFTTIGPGLESDALFAGMTVPQLILSVINGSMMSVLVPLLAGESVEQAHHDSWGFFYLVCGSFFVFAVVLQLTAHLWVPLSVPGFSRAGQLLTIDLTNIQLLGMVFTALSGVQCAVYNARQQFFRAEFSSMFSIGVSLLILAWALPKYGVVAAAWISTLRYVLQTIIMMPAMGRFIRPHLKAQALQEAWRRLKPLLVGTTFYKTEPLIDRYLLSMSGSGSLSIFYLGQQIFGAGNSLLGKAVVAPLVPKLSMKYKCGDWVGYQKVYRRRLLLTIVVACLSLILFAVAGKSILGYLVGWGAFRANNVSLLWLVMVGLSGFFVGGAGGQITSSTFYACGDTRTPTTLGIIFFLLFIPVKIASFYHWGVIGIAIATSVYYVTSLTSQIFFLERGFTKTVSIK